MGKIHGLLIAFIILFGSNKLLYAQSSDWIAPKFVDTLNNPFNGDRASINEGKKLFNTICIVCHGMMGKGDGAAAAGLNKPTADLTSSKVQRQSDGVLFWKISEGNPPMLSFKSSLSEDQRWKIINYIRQLNSGQKENEISKTEPRPKEEKKAVKKVSSKTITSPNIKVSNPYAGIENSKEIFNKACAACHSIGKGKRTGPDLLGVTHRHPEEWLYSWIKCPLCRIEAGDSTALKLYKEFDNVLMPSNKYLEDGQLDGILKYIEKQGNLIADQQIINKRKESISTTIKYPENKQSKEDFSEPMSSVTAFFILVMAAIFIIVIYIILIVRIDILMNNIINDNNK